MNKNKKYCSLFCALMLVGAVSVPAYSAITFSSSPKMQSKMITTVQYMDESNPSLRKALNIHNLMNEISGILDVMTTADDLSKQKDMFVQQKEMVSSCSSKKLGNVFKDPKATWTKMADSYEQKRLALPEKKQKGQLNISAPKNKMADAKRNLDINREVMMDVYQNPSNWGEVNADASFPLWQDQVVAFEKQWNDYYDKMNRALGVPQEGRPNVDEKIRQDNKKYDQVLKAHQEYLASLPDQKKTQFTELPPKAPQPLPAWNEIMIVDADTKAVYPEMPDVWKDPKTRKDLIKSNPSGELAQVFEKGDINSPTADAVMGNPTSLEQEYNMRLVLDSLEKGTLSFNNTTSDMQQEFKKRLSDAGINVSELDFSTRSDYFKARKLLKAEKEKAIKEAEKHIQALEQQDAKHPELVQQRQKRQQMKLARMSQQAQEKLSDSEGIVQISQMSPAMQQKFVVEALKKDADATVFLTETNAMDVDQLMRERKSTAKIVAESQKQMEDVYKKQLENLPLMDSQCPY